MLAQKFFLSKRKEKLIREIGVVAYSSVRFERLSGTEEGIIHGEKLQATSSPEFPTD